MVSARAFETFVVVGCLAGVVALACKRSPAAPGVASGAPAATSVVPPPPPPPATNLAPLSAAAPIEDERNTIGVFRQAAPAAVFVTQKRVVVDYWAGQAVEVPAGSGSGFIWDKQGHIVTNFHVIQGARSLTVTLQDQSTHEAQVRGAEPRKDIAVLKIDVPADKLSPILLPDPKAVRLEVGQKAIAIGNPFGLDHTLTVGIVSALGRSMEGVGGVMIRDLVQTDAAINPGNSGGPLLDSGGRLIGMNTAIYSKSGAFAGIGFAVPVSSIQRVVPQIIRTGRAEQVGLGIRIDPDQRLEQRAGVRGVIVLGVEPGGPADKAGLRSVTSTARGLVLGDVIVGLDRDTINDYSDLYNALDAHQVGDKVKVKVRRGNGVVDLELALTQVQ
ncbi:MAG TPA: trypsin-like peptidase domain-containing protein [Polyangiaceae bacterium]